MVSVLASSCNVSLFYNSRAEISCESYYVRDATWRDLKNCVLSLRLNFFTCTQMSQATDAVWIISIIIIWTGDNHDRMVAWWTAGLEGNQLIMHLGRDSYKISSHLPCCLQAISHSVTIQNCGLKPQSLIFFKDSCPLHILYGLVCLCFFNIFNTSPIYLPYSFPFPFFPSPAPIPLIMCSMVAGHL